MGVPLRFLYHVELDSHGDQYIVRTLSCEPDAGDTGFQSMCAYLADPQAFQQVMCTAPELVGLTLDEVLAWDPITGPAGCLCYESHRHHKWKAVLQTIHYSLREHDKPTP
jgi:hypothetical protein